MTSDGHKLSAEVVTTASPRTAETAEEWNARFPVGVLVEATLLQSAPGFPALTLTTRTRSKAWTLGHGDAVVLIEGRTGGYRIGKGWMHVLPNPSESGRDERSASPATRIEIRGRLRHGNVTGGYIDVDGADPVLTIADILQSVHVVPDEGTEVLLTLEPLTERVHDGASELPLKDIWPAIDLAVEAMSRHYGDAFVRMSAMVDFIVGYAAQAGPWSREQILEAWLYRVLEMLGERADVPRRRGGPTR